MDKLDQLFQMQQLLNDDIIEKRKISPLSDVEWMQKYLLAMLSEMSELLEEINYKWWKNPKPLNEQAVKEELIDILHFYLSLCLKSGMTAEELFSIYKGKNQENFDRQSGRSKKEGYCVETETINESSGNGEKESGKTEK